MIEIVSLAAEHLAQVHQIEVVSQPDPWSLSLFESCLSARYINFVAIENNQVLGFLIADWIAGEACLMNICVAPEQRKNGIAKALHHYFVGQLLIRGTDKLWLEVRQSNSAALALYTQLGYRQIAVRKSYYAATAQLPAEDAIIMQVELTS
ncbi:ribosomal protein S18-alanine N-acetyltransferase [Catenovulum agarivorans]|uniref:ribosomal protein S18-alanine N-acetyltransferase n=1 Tax=Catenovulum agarivorans TaxID=1172192 RepID=UPI000310227C|nr:ribosomal protein S18-alanine N-acetyltransferase [Catenovulum agarivorans]